MRQILFLLLTTCFAASAIAQDAARNNLVQPGGPPRATRPADTQSEAIEEFVIGPEDVLSIIVWKELELTNNRVIVRPDGKIGLTLLNDVQAAGLTPKELQARITEELKRFVTGPQVSVIVQEIRSQNVYVIGAVTKSGVYPLGGPTTVMEILVRAGGLAEFAKADEIQIVRTEGDKPRRFRFNYKLFLEGRDYQQNIRLRSGDMIIVP